MRVGTALAGAILLLGWFVPSALAHTMDADVQTTYRSPDDAYLVGYVVWKDGKHSLTWDANEATDAAGGPAATGSTEQVFRFTSKPTPASAWLNSSRSIQADFFLKNGGPSNQIVMRVGGVLLGGAFVRQQVDRFDPPPTGYDSVLLQMHAEMGYIPSGSLIEIEYTATSQGQFKVGGEPRSVVRIPLYRPYEIALRQPQVGLEGGAQPGPSGSGAAGFLALVPLVAARRGARPLLVAVALATSGCFGGGSNSSDAAGTGGPTQPGSGATSTIAPDDENQTGLVTETTGGISGTVADRDGYPIPGAHVAVLGTGSFATSDRGGAFRFGGLAPRAYELRIDADGFLTAQADVQVAAKSITHVQVTLLRPGEKSEGDFRRHNHDYWGDQKQILLYEADMYFHSSFSTPFCCGGNAFNWAPYEGQTAAAACAMAEARLCAETFTIPSADPLQPLLIKPGTNDIEVKLTWTGTGAATADIGVGFIGNHETARQYGGQNWTLMYPRGSGVPTHIRANQEMMDAGHQLYSTWTFMVYTMPEQLGLITNPIHVAITIHKGHVPLEPAHVDRWGANLTIVALEKGTYTPTLTGTYPYSPAGWTPAELIPPETVWVEIELTQTKAGTPAYDWELLYKSARYPPANYDDFSHFAPITHVSKEGLKKRFVLVLKDGDADPFYARVSAWRFLLDDRQEPLPTGGRPENFNPDGVSFEARIVAHRDPAPTT